jgi:hypothetical protein
MRVRMPLLNTICISIIDTLLMLALTGQDKRRDAMLRRITVAVITFIVVVTVVPLALFAAYNAFKQDSVLGT